MSNRKINQVSIIRLILCAAWGCGVAAEIGKAAEGVDLAGLDGWDVVVADDATASEVYAAEEF
jgi:hypothetical protein